MTDVFPALELSVAALTFVLGFVSARHHSYLGSARDLVNRMGGELQSPTRHASRDRSRELLMLAQRGLATDYVVLSTVIVSWVWVGLTTWLAIWAASQDALGGGGQPKAATPVLIAMLVASLGTWDFIAVQQQLRMLRTRTTVGLLATAASAADQREFDDVIPVATLAASRNPALAWPFAYRARARIGQAANAVGDEQGALRRMALDDMRRVIERDPSEFAGLLDWFADSEELDLDEDVIGLLLPHLTSDESRFHAARRLRSHVDGVLRRRVLGPKDADRDRAARQDHAVDLAAKAVAHWRVGQVAQGLETVERILDRGPVESLDLREAVVAAGLLQLTGADERAARILQPLLDVAPDDVLAEGVPKEDVDLHRIAAVFGMQLRATVYGRGALSNAARRWEDRAAELFLDEAIRDLAKAVFVPSTETVSVVE